MTPSDGERTPRGFLADLHESDLAVVLQYTQARLYEAGEYAVDKGDVDRSFFIISRGVFEVRVPPDAAPRRVRVLEPGRPLRGGRILRRPPAVGGVIALEEAEALVL